VLKDTGTFKTQWAVGPQVILDAIDNSLSKKGYVRVDPTEHAYFNNPSYDLEYARAWRNSDGTICIAICPQKSCARHGFRLWWFEFREYDNSNGDNIITHILRREQLLALVSD
jgi:hypothetical protein